MSEFVIAEGRVPTEVGGEGWSEFVAMTDVRNEIEEGIVGLREWSFEPEELLPPWLDPIDQKRLFLARIDGQIVGRAVYEFTEGDPVAWIQVEVLERFRGRGIATALYDFVLEIAVTEGRTKVQGEGWSRPDDPGERVVAPSGFGSVSSQSPSSRFMLGRGFQLQLVLRFSRLALPVQPELLAEHRTEAENAAGADYRIVRWVGPTPEEWLDDIAVLHARMFTDAPHGELEFSEENWDAERVRIKDALDAQSPRAILVAAIEHVPTSTLVAFTELTVPQDKTRAVAQRDTLVLEEHRGHRLGMLLKVENIAQLQSKYPGHPSISTTNADENQYMLKVNEAVGFVPVAYSGVWKKSLDAN